MLGRLNHVALAVPDMAKAVETYRTSLGAKISAPQALPEHGVTVVFIDVGNTKIELLEPLGEGSPIEHPLITRHSLRESRHKLHLLLAEDNAVNQTLAVRMLQRFGHTVSVAHNGLQAVAQWQEDNFDAILMDVDMPMMNGYQATQEIGRAHV